MQKDLKIGMIIGLAVVTGAAVWLSTRGSLSVKSRMLQLNSPAAQENIAPAEPPSNTETDTKDYNEQKPSALLTNGQTEKIISQRFHLVRDGETLSDISRQYYGSANKWQKILDANRSILKDANTLRAGIKIIIPP